MQVTLTNLDASGAGLGTISRLVGGVTGTNLLGLWLMNGGTNGNPVTSIADASGNNMTANNRANYTGATQRSYGLEVGTNGANYQTPVPINTAERVLTVFVAHNNTVPGNEGGVYNNVVGSTTNSMPADQSGNFGNSPVPVLNFEGSGTTGVAVFDAGGDLLGSVRPNEVLLDVDQPTVAAMTIDGPNNQITTHLLGGTSASTVNPAIGSYFNGTDDLGNIEIGMWPNGSVRSSAAKIGEIYAVAAYRQTFDQAGAQAIMAQMQVIAEARGVTGF